MISVQTHDFSLDDEYQQLRKDSPRIGAIVTFSGLVRDMLPEAGNTRLFLEHYPGMTEKTLEDIVGQAKQRWEITQARIIHRVGHLACSDQIVFVGISSPHRGEAFSACEFIMDFLKTQAPFWKKEITPQGETWVEAKASDQAKTDSWDN